MQPEIRIANRREDYVSRDVTARGSFGERAAVLAIGARRVAVTGLSASLTDALGQRYGDSVSTTGDVATADVIVRAEAADADSFHDVPAGNFEYQMALDTTRADGVVELAGLAFCATLTGAIGELLIGDPVLAVQAIENTARALLALHLPRTGSVMLHSGCVAVEGGAVLYPGHSGAGKSTLSKLAHDAGLRVLGDEIHILDADGTVHGTPFSGDLGNEITHRVNEKVIAFVDLAQSDDEGLRPLSRGKMFATALAGSPIVNRVAALAEELEDVLFAALSTAPSHQLRFRPGAHVWPMIAEALATRDR